MDARSLSGHVRGNLPMRIYTGQKPRICSSHSAEQTSSSIESKIPCLAWPRRQQRRGRPPQPTFPSSARRLLSAPPTGRATGTSGCRPRGCLAQRTACIEAVQRNQIIMRCVVTRHCDRRGRLPGQRLCERRGQGDARRAIAVALSVYRSAQNATSQFASKSQGNVPSQVLASSAAIKRCGRYSSG